MKSLTLWRWLALLAAACALVPTAPGLAEEQPPPEQEEANKQNDYDEAENAFLGGPDPPCMFPCGVVVGMVYLVALVVALMLGLVVTGVILVVVVVLAGLCLALAAWFAWQGMWLAAAVMLLPVVLAVWAIVARGPSGQRANRDDGPAKG